MKVRRLNGTSDMVRYHIMRNRGFVARYLAEHGDYHPFWFTVGTALTFGKEMIRIAAVDRTWISGTKAVVKGMRDGRKARRDPNWVPMQPLKASK